MKRTACHILIVLNTLFAWGFFSDDEAQKISPSKPDSAVSSDAEKAGETDLLAELAAAKKELCFLRKELADVLRQSEKRDEEYRRLKMSIAGIFAGTEKKAVSEREEEALDALLSVNSAGKDLVTRIMEFCAFLDAFLEKEQLSDVDRVRIKCRMDELKSSAVFLNAYINPPAKTKILEECRVLAVNDELQVVVLAAGSVHGVNSGLTLRVKVKEENILLKVIAVRPFICAAIVTDGDLEDLAPGMIADIGK